MNKTNTQKKKTTELTFFKWLKIAKTHQQKQKNKNKKRRKRKKTP